MKADSANSSMKSDPYSSCSDTGMDTRSGEICGISAVDMKNRWLALLLAWVFPGLGHLYQKRIEKGLLFGLPILMLLVCGMRAGTYYPTLADGQRGPARYASCVYCDFPSNEGGVFQRLVAGHLYFIPQAACGIAAIPAIIQASRFSSGKTLLWNGAFAPPTRNGLGKSYVDSENTGVKNPTFDELVLTLSGWFDIGSIYVAVAGLLNVLVMFDAFAGPVIQAVHQRDEDNHETEERQV